MAKITVHGHFYQPPRENPWTGEIDPQPDAAPFRDWNERVHSECYEPNAFVRIETPDGEELVNNFELLSFNVGPTLLEWIQKAHPKTYQRIIGADRLSVERLGHGNAIAQAYHHTILPLSPPRDIRTQIAWGLADFHYRFGREAKGMWLPETAASDTVLGALIDAGVQFTILAPWQAANWRDEDGEWVDAREHPVETRIPHLYRPRDGTERSMVLFFYDAEIARAIAFERGVASAETFAEMFAGKASENGMVVHAATDGETYGHHVKFSEMGLAYGLLNEMPKRGLEVTNYASFLTEHSPRREVRISEGEGTSWSCAHGVGRWKRNCGCSTGGQPGWNQTWRGPLRAALEIVRDAADEAFGRVGRTLFKDPWVARNEYIHVVLGDSTAEDFVKLHAIRSLPVEDVDRAIHLLEMQRLSMSMFTSCAWFFNDLAGIETVQIMRYAARVLEMLIHAGQHAPVDAFLSVLATAHSNDPAHGSGVNIFLGANNRP